MAEENNSILPKIFQVISRKDRRILLVYFAVASMLWLFGAWNISFAWILLFVAIYVFGEFRSELSKRKRQKFRVMSDESNFSKIKTFPVPPMHLSESENAMWLNEIINRLWPSIEGMTRNIIKENVEPEIQKNLPAALKTLYFDKIDLGQKPPFIGNIKSYAGGSASKTSEIIMDVDLSYNGDAQVKLTVKNVKLGISDFQIHGPLRIILKPLLSDYTVVGGITVFFSQETKDRFQFDKLVECLRISRLKENPSWYCR